MKRFTKSFTRQEPIPEEGIARAVEVMRSGALHRYHAAPDEESEAAALEREYAAYQGTRYCVACASCGYALHIALCAAGIREGEPVLTNAFTLAPVPGAIHNAGGVPVLVEIDDSYCIDLVDLRRKARDSGARFLVLSHMRGHIADMDAVVALCGELGIFLIEDCAHTMGARWNGVRSGNFGRIGCFSTQSYKHMNSGEGGLLTTDDPEIAARAVILSGSYMFYQRHGARADDTVFDAIRLHMPNYSGRMDNLRAAVIRPQIAGLDARCARWNDLYGALETGLRGMPGVVMPDRPAAERFVGSSLQFRVEGLDRTRLGALVRAAAARGVDLKWFGEDEPRGFTSRYDSWKYLGEAPALPRTRAVLESTFDIRIPLTFTVDDCRLVAEVIGEALAEVRRTAAA
jgi:dTDP-4-amino-4,6-dideoxygalactose transaminase